jgi:hypothetical protein
MRSLLILIIILFSTSTLAAELTALKLQQYCDETEKGFQGKPFDSSKSDTCRGYMMGFFDSAIISQQLTGKAQFCIPPALPKSYNNSILNNWVGSNKSIADTTTAAVALFSAYNKAFPCR